MAKFFGRNFVPKMQKNGMKYYSNKVACLLDWQLFHRCFFTGIFPFCYPAVEVEDAKSVVGE